MMSREILRRCCALILSLSLVYLPLAQAQSSGSDHVAPSISHTPSTTALDAGKPTVFQALVTDNEGVESVVLFYRQQGAQGYERVDMSRIGATDMYKATLPMETIAQPGLEYYLQASDLAGNILWRGSSFSPLAVTVVENAPAIAPVEAAEERAPSQLKTAEKSGGGIGALKWVLVAVGVGAVAALAAGGGSGGGGGGGPQDSSLVVTGPALQ